MAAKDKTYANYKFAAPGNASPSNAHKSKKNDTTPKPDSEGSPGFSKKAHPESFVYKAR